MKKQFLYKAITYFVAMVGACLVNLAVSAMAVKIVNLFIVVDYFWAAVVKLIVAFIVVAGVVGALAYYEAYKNADFKIAYIGGAIALAGGAHLVVSIPLMFYPFIAGGTRFLAGLIDMGIGFDSEEKVKDIYLWTYLISFVIYLTVEILTAVVCGILGKRRRLTLRRYLTETKGEK